MHIFSNKTFLKIWSNWVIYGTPAIRNNMTGSKQPETTDALSTLSRRRVLQGTAGAGVLSLLSASGVSADGTTELVVRAEEVDVPILAESASAVDELKAKAEESQAPIVEYVEGTDGLSVKNQFWVANALLLEVDTEKVDPDKLAAQSGVTQVHPNYQLEIPQPEASNVDAEASDVTYGLDQIDIPEVWDRFDTRGQGAKIAVLDTGVDPDHPDIDITSDNFAEFDDSGNEVDAEPHDSAYHGTHVSGTATGGDDSGTAIGVAPDAELMHALILPGGSGSFAQIIGGIEWAVEQDADVINMSLGASGYYNQMVEPVRNAQAAGTTVVAAAGNDGSGTSGTPGNVYDSFAVGASNESEGIASFSSGETITTSDAWGSDAPDDWPDSYIVPDASAPGVDVYSSYPVDHSEGPYNSISGTSMASPHMSGLVGLMASAGAEGLDPDQAQKALIQTAWKPEGESDEQDTRYGHGIVDAVAAVGRVAANSGVQGTVTDADGNPIEGATIELDGFPAETDENGEYKLRAASGTYELTVDAFGHAEQSITVEIGDEFLTQDFTLADDLAVTPITEQPQGLESGESFDVEIQAANAEAITVDLSGSYDGESSLLVNGEEATFGEAFEFGRPVSEVVTVTVETGDDGAGDIELEHTLSGLGETITVTTGPTSVYSSPVSVAIVDDTSAYGSDVQSLLESELQSRFQFSTLDVDEALSAAKNRDHDVYVAQNLGTDEDTITEFTDVAAAPEVGVVYFDQFGTASDSIYQISGATGDPADVSEEYVLFATPSVNYTIDADHPVFDGVGGAGDTVTVNEPEAFSSGFYYYGGFHSSFEDYRGPIAGQTLAGVSLGASDTGDGLAVDDLSRTTLAASLGVGTYVGKDVFTADGKALLGNIIKHTAQTPPVKVTEKPAEQIAPGEPMTVEIEASGLTEMELGLEGLRFFDRSDLTLTVNGEQVAFGDPITYDDPYEGTIEIAIDTPAGQVGEFSLDTRFAALTDTNHEVETTATFRPTTVYKSPLTVPSDLDDLQAAVDFVNSGDEVVVGGGTYKVSDDRGSGTGLYVGTSDITIRGAEGETVEIVNSEDVLTVNAIYVDADDVTIENVSANVLGGRVDPQNTLGYGIRVNELVSGTTIRNATVAGTVGVFLDEDVSDVHIENSTALDSAMGFGTDVSGGPVTNATITNVTVERPSDTGWGGVYVENADGITVTDSDITYTEDADAGVFIEGDYSASDDNRIANNVIVGPDDDDPSSDTDNGVFIDDANVEIENNSITDAHTGIRVGDLGFGDRDVYVEGNTVENATTGYKQTGDFASVEDNTFEAETGLNLEGGFYGLEADAIVARYNDLSATDVVVVGEPDDGYSDPEGPFDVRLNYLGDRSYGDTIADGEAAYDPFLTAPPAEVDKSETTQIATDLYLDPDDSYGLGIPGPTDKTIYEILGVENFREFSGTMEYWDSKPGKWKKVRGQGSNKHVETLEAFRITPDEGVRAVVDFLPRTDTPSGLRDSNPGTTTLERGWNVVAAPQYGDASEVFGDAVEEVSDELASPGEQVGDGALEAFTAYKVKASESVELDAGIGSYAPTMTGLYESLGLDPVIHDGVGPDADASADDLTVTDVLNAVPSDEAADAVAAFVSHRISQRLETVDDVETATDEIGAAANETVRAAPASHSDLVEEAALEVAEHAFRSIHGATNAEEDDADFDTDVVRIHAENRTSSSSSLGLLGSVLSD